MSKYREVQNRLNQILERADVGDRVSRSIDLFLTALVIINIISILATAKAARLGQDPVPGTDIADANADTYDYDEDEEEAR